MATAVTAVRGAQYENALRVAREAVARFGKDVHRIDAGSGQGGLVGRKGRPGVPGERCRRCVLPCRKSPSLGPYKFPSAHGGLRGGPELHRRRKASENPRI